MSLIRGCAGVCHQQHEIFALERQKRNRLQQASFILLSEFLSFTFYPKFRKLRIKITSSSAAVFPHPENPVLALSWSLLTNNQNIKTESSWCLRTVSVAPLCTITTNHNSLNHSVHDGTSWDRMLAGYCGGAGGCSRGSSPLSRGSDES